MELMIKTEQLVFEYHKNEQETTLRAINDVSLQIEKGSFTAVIGRNGSGKSTLARHFNGMLLPSEGYVLVNNLDTREEEVIWQIRQIAGMVFQNPDNQMVSAIVEDDVAFGPENLGVLPEEIRIRVDEALKSVGMYEERKRAPHMLSGGQKQRVAIAGVIAMMPECVIFDEPTAMLDPRGRKEVMEVIRYLHQVEKKTVVLITHFMEEAILADRLLIMEQGQIRMDGKPHEIFQRVKELKEMGLSAPFAAELAEKLREEGMQVPQNIVTIEEMVNFLCQ